jgi:hypothetical protein
MIVEFNIAVIGPDMFLVTAIMCEGPPLPVGVFDNQEDIDEACVEFEAEFRRHLH